MIFIGKEKRTCIEGHRYWDLVRNNLDVTRLDLANNYQVMWPLVLETSNFRILAIPPGELDANPNIREQQNSGY